MSDRAARAALEAAQAELKNARAQLEQPLDAARLRAELSAQFDRLAQEAHGLAPQLDAVRTELAAARDYADRRKGLRAEGRTPSSPQRMLWLFFVCTAVCAYPMLQLAVRDGVPGWVPVTLLLITVGLIGWEVLELKRHR